MSDPNFHQPSLLAAILQTHHQFSSWRQRLEWVKDEVTAETFQALPGQLVPFIVYLRFLATGELSCQEDGRHFRPNHHARAAMDLEQVLKTHTTKNNAWLMRRLYPWLPSYDEAYQRSEPLTRIRDIAHRNDIPKDLKNEIKHQLQNKLHRCAGPEDLKTSRNILQRITAPDAHYSPQFVEQFQIFNRELEEFFNAAALDQRLDSLDLSGDNELSECIRQFSQLKANTMPGNEEVMELLRQLTQLRLFLSSRQEKSEGAQAQRIRMCDIALEDFAFSQFSDAINRLEKVSWGATWQWPLELSVLILENITLSFIEQEEAGVLIKELNVWRENIDVKDPLELLRLRASLQRALRLCGTYVDTMLDLFPPVVTKLGQTLGVADHAIEQYCEGDIRANLVFQLSRLIELIQKALDSTLDLSPWETVVPGIGVGQLIRVKNLLEIEQATKPTVVWLDHADGDENIPELVCGLILNHPLAHLSHLAVRARQLNIPFTVARRTSSNIDLNNLIEPLIEEQVRIEIKADELMVNLHSGSIEKPTTVQSKIVVNVPLAELSQHDNVINLDQATVTNCGGKAAGAGHLLRLAKDSKTLFEAPFGVALPFGLMHALMYETPAIKQYQMLQETIATAPVERLDALLEEIQSVVFNIKIPQKLLKSIKTHFQQDNLLAVRSSSNCEDLEDFSGAGLHDSVLGVKPDTIEQAIQQVWASLWNRRAVLARLQANVPQHEAHMAILLQTMVHPEWSFIMHTSNPYADREQPGAAQSTMIVEIAVGLGEILASANEPGSPYRLSYEQATGKTNILSMANYSFALLPNQRDGLARERLDYSSLALSSEINHLLTITKRLGAIAKYLEQALGRAQDVEGCYANDTLYIVQTRAQQGL